MKKPFMRMAGSALLTLLLGFFLSGCGGGSTPPPTPQLVSIKLTPSNPILVRGTTLQLTATGSFSDQTTKDLSTQVRWASSNVSIVTIDNSGLATAIQGGTADVSASLNGISTSTLMTVTTTTLVAIAITPANPAIAMGTSVQFMATGTFADASTQDLTVQVAWSSANTSVATIDSRGLAQSTLPGTTSIVAAVHGLSASTTLTVTTANLMALAVTPANSSIARGATQQFTAMGTYDDGSTQNVTTSVTWTSSNTALVSISNTAPSKGLATGIDPGTVSISAALFGKTGSTSFTVRAVACVVSCPPGYMCQPNGDCAGGASDNLVFDLKTVHVGGQITLNGAVPRAITANCSATVNPDQFKARVTFTETTFGQIFYADSLCSDSSFSFVGDIYPGTYEVSVSGSIPPGMSNLPDSASLVEKGLVVTADKTGLSYDLKTVQLSGQVTLNGAAPANGPDCASFPAAEKARVELIEITQGYYFRLPMSCTDTGFAFSGPVYPGTYRVSVKGLSENGFHLSNLPLDAYVAESALVIGGDLNGKVLDVKTVQFSGQLTLNGMAPSNGADCLSQPGASKASIDLSETTKGYYFRLPMSCADAGFAVSGTIYPGTYRVTLQGLSENGANFSNLPLGLYLADSALTISADVSGKVFDLKTVQFAGKVTFNGMIPGTSPDCASQPSASKARVTLLDFDHGYTFYLPIACAASDFAFSGTIYPGTYRVTVQGLAENGHIFSNLPMALYVADPALGIPADVSGKIYDVKTVQFAGQVTLNGATPTNGPDCASQPSASKASVNLKDVNLGQSFRLSMLCADTGFAFSGAVYPGTYRVTVQSDFANGARLSDFLLEPYLIDATMTLASNTAGKVLNVKTAQVAGHALRNGMAPQNGPGCTSQPTAKKASVDLREIITGYFFRLPMSCANTDFAFSGTIYPGTYRATVQDLTYSGPPLSNLPTQSYVAVDRLVLP